MRVLLDSTATARIYFHGCPCDLLTWIPCRALRCYSYCLRRPFMVKHGAISRSHVYRMLSSKDARVRRAAFTLLEASNPRLRRDCELFLEIIRFIWDANPSYDVYREFSKRHLFVGYKVHELISARLKMEKREQQ